MGRIRLNKVKIKMDELDITRKRREGGKRVKGNKREDKRDGLLVFQHHLGISSQALLTVTLQSLSHNTQTYRPEPCNSPQNITMGSQESYCVNLRSKEKM